MDLSNIQKLQCPRCGQSIHIRVSARVSMTIENMTPINYENPTLSMYDEAKCNSCNHIGTIEEFYDAAQGTSVSASVIGDALRRI